MAELPQEWSAYARLQKQLDNKSAVDDTAWGLEAGLNRLVEGRGPDRASVDEEAVTRAVSNSIRRERYRRRLRALQLSADDFEARPLGHVGSPRRLATYPEGVAATLLVPFERPGSRSQL